MKKLLLITLSILLIFTGCGNNKSEDSNDATRPELLYEDYDDGYVAEGESADIQSNYLQTSTPEENGFGSGFSNETTEASSAEHTGSPIEGNQTASESNAGKITSTMLVYRGDLRIDTLDFNKSVADFKALINEKGGFVENESFSDNYSTSTHYVVDSEKKHNIYNATVRVPSTEYDAVMNAANILGDIRNRSSEATNVTQEYGTYKSQLEIYQAEYNRYLSLLEKATEDEYALMIENELFDIQLKIASLKSGITNIENDVAYSYINICIKEVSEYEEKPAPTDTFFERLKNTCSNSWSNFLEFLEELLFGVIMNIYAIIIILIIVIIIWRKLRKRKQAKIAYTNQQIATKQQEIATKQQEIAGTGQSNDTTAPEKNMDSNSAQKNKGSRTDEKNEDNWE